MKHQSQTGSVHALIIIVLVVALIGALGYIFWNSLNNRTVDSDKAAINTSVSAKEEPVVNERAEACMAIEKMCFDYPKTWSVDLSTSDNGDFPGDKTSITSKNGFVISATSGINGIGGTCNEDEAGTLVVVETTALSIGGYGIGDRAPYDSQKLLAAKVITVNEQGTSFRPSVLLTTNLKLATKGVKEGCEVGYATLFSGKTSVTNASGDTYVGLMTFGGSSGKNQFSAPSATQDDAVKRLGSSDYNEAYSILTSVRYK